MKNILATLAIFSSVIVLAAGDSDGHLGDYDLKHPIDVPVMRNDSHTGQYLNRHNSRISRIRKNESHHYDIVFAGDSITHNWERKREKRDVYGQDVWDEEFAGLQVLNCGFGGDRVETLHWRLANGELDGYKADNFCILIGTNNRQNSSEEISLGIKALIKTIEEKHPESRIVLMTILPRCDIHPPKVTQEIIDRVRGANPLIEEWAKCDPRITLLNLDPYFLNEDGSVKTELFNDGIHPNPAGYRIWARRLKEVVAKSAPMPLLAGFHPDPSVCKGADGAYYLTTSSFLWQPGLPIYRSENFRDWSLVGHVVKDFGDLLVDGDGGVMHDDDGIWAPTIRCHEGTYYCVFTFHGKTYRNYIASAKNPAGPWTKPVHVREADGGIDPSLFFDDDGKVYFLGERTAKEQKWRGHTEIYIAEFDLASGQIAGEKHVLSSGVTDIRKNCEGPHLYKIDGKYVLLHAEGGTSEDHAETGLKANSVFGPYAPFATNPLITRRGHGADAPLQATGHADIVETGVPGEFYAVFLAKRPNGDDHRVILGRETFACKAYWQGGDMRFDDKNLIAGKVVTPEEECLVGAGEKRFLVRRARSWEFDEKTDGDSLVLWRSAQGYILLERKQDGVHLSISDRKGVREIAVASCSGALRLVSDDGIAVKAFCGATLVGEVSTLPLAQGGNHTRFNGLGIGIVDAGHAVDD